MAKIPGLIFQVFFAGLDHEIFGLCGILAGLFCEAFYAYPR